MLHGGNLYEISKKYNININDIIDFSGNITPFPITNKIYPLLCKNTNIIEQYPDPEYKKLKNSISNYCNCKEEFITVGNGTTELIKICINSLQKGGFIISPTYSEYINTLTLNRLPYSIFPLFEYEDFKINVAKLLNNMQENRLIIMCNPNNPTGSSLNNQDISLILDEANNKNSIVLIDETYIEFSNNESAINLCHKFDNLIVIRGTSKFFGIPGIRLGYTITSNHQLHNDLEKNKDLWNVNSFASLIGENMFLDDKFISNTKHYIHKEKEIFYNNLNPNVYKCFNSDTNFILVKILNHLTSDYIFSSLIQNNLLIRNAKNIDLLNNKYFRFCILKNNDNNSLLHLLNNLA